MNANGDLGRRLSGHYATEAPHQAPDWVLTAALETIDTTPQRRVLIRVPWRIPPTRTYASMAVAAALVIVVGSIGLALLLPPTDQVGGPPVAPSPSPSASPSPSPSPSPAAPPALTETFTSNLNGISISYPAGWTTMPATKPWTTQSWNFQDPSGDFIFDPALNASLFLAIHSGSLGAANPDQWVADHAAFTECAPTEPATIDGVSGATCVGTDVAVVTAGGRGYIIRLYTGDGAPSSYDRAWFEKILATVKLSPGDAVDAAPSASP